MGRKTKYDPDTFPLLAEQYAREGHTDTEIANKLGVHHSTFYDYQERYPEFRESIREGKKPVNALVEKAALKKAIGYEFEEEHIEYVGTTKGKTAKIKSVKKVKRHFQPSDTAIRFWLRNRDPERWPDKQEIDFNQDVEINVNIIGRNKKDGE